MTAAARRRAEQAAERDEAAHVKAECALREHPALGRWLRQTPSGRLVLDRAKITAEARLDGKYLLSTSDPDLSAEDVALGYKNLLEAERGFRDLKSTIELRPVFHRIEPRIRAHVLLCWLALLLIRVAERHTSQTWRHINRELGRLHAITLAGPAGTFRPPSPPPPNQAFFRPASSPRHPGSPPSTLPEQQKPSRPASGQAWTHARLVTTRPFSQPDHRFRRHACPRTAEPGTNNPLPTLTIIETRPSSPAWAAAGT
jgi:hypothetical protein